MGKAKKKAAAKTHKRAPVKPPAAAAAAPITHPAAPRSRGVPSDAEQHATVRDVARPFLSRIPAAANSSGYYQSTDETEYRVENGLYRIEGTDWIFQFRHRRLVEVQRAAPPNFGGPNVVIVPAV